MPAEVDADERYGRVDRALADWRQGDCALGEQWFAHRLLPVFPVTASGRAAAEEGAHLAEEQVLGFALVTQTCDIVRSCKDRPFVEVCPLVEVDDVRLREIERGRRPGYGLVPTLAQRRIVADLDRVMTVEKPVLAEWIRTPGWTTDAEGRAFAAALARKRVRFAFPDDFTAFVEELQRRLQEKHDKESVEGRGLRALREIRVQATPSWDGPDVTLLFWFVRQDADSDFEGTGWSDLLDEWLRLVPATGRFSTVHGQVATLEEMNALDYVGSDSLDLDHLSSRSLPAQPFETHMEDVEWRSQPGTAARTGRAQIAQPCASWRGRTRRRE